MSKPENRRGRARNKNRRRRYRGRKPKTPVKPPETPISHRVHKLRNKLWNTAAIVTCVQHACESTSRNFMSEIQYTMEAVDEMINEVTGEMEGIIEELGGPPDQPEDCE